MMVQSGDGPIFSRHTHYLDDVFKKIHAKLILDTNIYIEQGKKLKVCHAKDQQTSHTSKNLISLTIFLISILTYHSSPFKTTYLSF